MKKKRFLSLLLTAALVLATFPGTAFAADDPVIWDGTADTVWYTANTAASEYTLNNAAELAGLAKLVNDKTETFSGKTIYLGADIVLNDTSDLQNWGTTAPTNIWTSIGSYSSETINSPFMGTFDGQGHSVSGIYFNDYGANGLFGCLSGAVIKNLGIKDSRIQGGYYVGALAAYVKSGTTIQFCWSDADVFGYLRVGGLVGALNGSDDATSSIAYCYNSGAVNASTNYAAGMAGMLYEGNQIVRCFNTGTITGNSSGGIVGDSESVDIYNSYYMTITGSASSGVGFSNGNNISINALTEAECKNGKLAYLINEGQTVLGHTTLNGTEFPQLSAFNNNLKYAVRVYFYDETTFCAERYTLKGSSFSDSGAEFPPDPTHSPFNFEGWTTASDGSGTDFTSTTAVTADLTVYARWSNFAGGDGSGNSPYLIGTPEQLRFMAEVVNSDNGYFSDKHYKLNADIGLGAVWTIDADTSEATLTEGTDWIPIGYSSTPFSGVFDGDGHMVSGIYINNSDDYQGLFGYVQGGSVTNLTIEDSYICGNGFIGAVAGYLSGSVSHCHSDADVKGAYNLIGGICGYLGSATVSASTNTGAVSGNPLASEDVGGIAGFLYYSTVSESVNSGAVSNLNCVGGIAGGVGIGSLIKNCFNTGTISGNSMIGGLVGFLSSMQGYPSSAVTNSFNTGLITGNWDNKGGIVGETNYQVSISDSFYLQGSAAAGVGVGSDTATVKTETEFKNGETAHLLQGTQTSLIWGHSVLDGSELPRLAALGSGVEKVLRVRFYDDATESGTFVLYSTGYTLTGGTAAFPVLADVTWVDSANNTYSESSTFSADTDLYTNRASSVPAAIASTMPTALTEAAANDGSLIQGTVVITIANGTLATDIVKADVAATNLPAGLSYTVTRDSGTQLTITISGNAAAHANANDVSSLTFTIAQAKVTGATGDLTTASISIDFGDSSSIRLTAPTGLAWDGAAPGNATWSAVPNASSYTVQLYQDGMEQGSAVTGITNAYYDFTTAIAAAGSGDYTFKVTAIGDGSNYTNSDLSNASAAYSYTSPILSAALSPDHADFDKEPDNQADVTTMITWNSATGVTDVKASDVSIGAGNYSVSGNTLTIKKEYLAAQATGSLPLTVEFNAGDAATLTISITDTTLPSISPASRNYDLSAPADVTTAITWNSAASVTDVVYSISPDATHYTLDTGDYTVSDDTLTIKNSFFSGLSLTTGAALEFDITFNTGATATLTVNVVNGYTPSDDADLSSLSVNGTPVSGFDPDDTEYDVQLPYGATSATVTATASYSSAQVSITQASSLPGSATVTVTAENGTTTKTYAINLTIAASVTTYTITFNSNGAAYTTKTVNAGESIGSAAWPPNPTRSSYIFGGWFTGENGAGTQFTSATPVNATMTVYAKWTYSGGGSSSGVASTTPTTSTYNAEVYEGNGSNVRLPVIVDKSSGNASVDVGSGNNLMSEGKTKVITVPAIPDVDTYTLCIPVPSLSMQNEQGTLAFSTDTGTVTVPSNMLAGVAGISGSKAEISIGQGNKDKLPSDVKAIIGDKPLISLSLSIDGKQIDWSNPNAPITVSIPYTPTATELANPESIVIWYIDGGGNAVSVPNGHYDPETGTVTFATTHFSDYAVVYKPVSFKDVAKDTWYNRAVSFIAARGITYGTGNGNFSPEAKLTRGEFIVMLMRAYGIAADESPSDNFTDAGNVYYTGYLATAKRLGISAGVGNNMFAPGKQITRQEMFTLLYNTLKEIGSLPESKDGKDLIDFSDAGDVALWAKNAMTLLVKTGTVSGSGGKLSPTATTTRAEMAQVLYNLLGK